MPATAGAPSSPGKKPCTTAAARSATQPRAYGRPPTSRVSSPERRARLPARPDGPATGERAAPPGRPAGHLPAAPYGRVVAVELGGPGAAVRVRARADLDEVRL